MRNHSVAVLPKEKHSRPNPYNDENLRGLFGKNFIVTEPVADGGTLKEFLKQDPRPTDEVLKRIMGCLISGLAIMHAEGIHHHDIHTENILVHNNSPLYNDFGLKTDRQPSNSNGADPAGGETRSAERDVLLLAGALIEILAVLTENDVLTKCKTMRASRSQKLSETDFNRSLRANLTELKQTSQVSGFMDLVLKMLDLENRINSRDLVRMLIKLKDGSICQNCLHWHSVGELKNISRSKTKTSTKIKNRKRKYTLEHRRNFHRVFLLLSIVSSRSLKRNPMQTESISVSYL